MLFPQVCEDDWEPGRMLCYNEWVTPSSYTVIHHVYRQREDLLPACNAIPGPEHVYSSDGERSSTAEFWHTGHDAKAVLAHAAVGHGCCTVCLELAQQMAEHQQ